MTADTEGIENKEKSTDCTRGVDRVRRTRKLYRLLSQLLMTFSGGCLSL